MSESKLAESWRGDRVAEAMLATGSAALEAGPARDVYPFWLLLEALGPIEPGGRLLELGCGTGHNIAMLMRERPGAFEYVGSDYSPEMIDVAAREVPGAEFFVADVLDPSLDLAGYDVVVAAGLIEVLEEWQRALDVVLAAPAEHVVLHRQRIARWRTRVEIETHYEGRSTYCVYLSMRALRRRVARHDRRVAAHVWREGEMHHSFLLSRT
jgi:SAM-dependent methyltransferase